MYLQPKFGKQKLLHTYGGTMKKYKKVGTNNIVSLQTPNPICSAFLIVSYCTLHREDSLCTLAHRFCFTRKWGWERWGWGEVGLGEVGLGEMGLAEVGGWCSLDTSVYTKLPCNNLQEV